MVESTNFIIEIASTDFETTRSAIDGGADRIELCNNLNEGGTTPAYGLIYQCKKLFNKALFPIIRPRSGDFLYSKDEFEIMKLDVRKCGEMGCNGIVTGLLNKDGTIDTRRTALLVKIAYPMEVTFHRAFDRCREPLEALEQLIDTGCQRILTSGQMPTAIEGIELIANLVRAADDRIIIMPGSGVRKENIKELAERTGCMEFHSSLRSKIKSKMEFIHPAFENSDENYWNHAIDPREVKALRMMLKARK